MTDPLRYYFILPRLARPVGGANFALWLVETLQQAGYIAAPLYPEPHFRYRFSSYAGESFHHPALRDKLTAKRKRPITRLGHFWSSLRSNVENSRLKPSAMDVFVLPEFLYAQSIQAIGPAAYVLGAQDVFGLTRAFVSDQASGAPQHPQITTAFTTSQASHEAATALFGRPCHHLRLAVARKGLEYRAEKKLQIAYMPRKRRAESALVTALLRSRRGLQDIPIVPIERMSNEERNRILSESLFFLSFSEQEGFGLPPAEAMATGSLVIGYTGVGGNEYFTADTGFPIEDNDIFRFVQTVEDVVTRYRSNPQPLDRLRQNASQTIWERYSDQAAHEVACKVWAEIDREIRETMASRNPAQALAV